VILLLIDAYISKATDVFKHTLLHSAMMNTMPVEVIQQGEAQGAS
jgi:hypothetical protein